LGMAGNGNATQKQQPKRTQGLETPLFGPFLQVAQGLQVYHKLFKSQC
jgi:hypothetical protein